MSLTIKSQLLNLLFTLIYLTQKASSNQKLPGILNQKLKVHAPPFDNRTEPPVVRVGIYIESLGKFTSQEMVGFKDFLDFKLGFTLYEFLVL